MWLVVPASVTLVLISQTENCVDFDRRTARELCDPDRCSRMPSEIAEDIEHQLRCAIYDRRLPTESRRRTDVAGDAHDLADSFEAAEESGRLRQARERSKTCALSCSFDTYVLADTAYQRLCTVTFPSLAGHIEHAALFDCRNI